MVTQLRKYEGQPVSSRVGFKSSLLRSARPVVFVFICLPILIALNQYLVRYLSIDLGDGDCKWTESVPLPLDSDPLGTLVASYPGGGTRTTWQQMEGLTGIQVGDDFEYSGEHVGIIKTQWPHYEGIWSYGSTLDQVILVVRNPRWAIPSFHNILYEINYRREWSEVYPYLSTLFTRRAPLAYWIKWRDLNFEEEIDLWAWHIDYYMEEGSQYWEDLDFERVGQTPFSFRDDEMKPWPKDSHCITDIDCLPKAVVSYEKLRKHGGGPDELRKIAEVLRGKKEMTVIADEAIECVWFETFVHAHRASNDNRDHASLPRESYLFTMDQMQTMANKLQFMKDKYSSEPWVNVTIAQDLVLAFDDYIADLGEELLYLQANPSPTPAPNADYHDELVSWYASVGRGKRYEVDKVQQMRGYWPLVENLYNETT